MLYFINESLLTSAAVYWYRGLSTNSYIWCFEKGDNYKVSDGFYILKDANNCPSRVFNSGIMVKN